MTSDPTIAAPNKAGPWGHFLVSVSACVLTVTIVGSAAFLANRIYTRYQLQHRIREFLGAIENRTPEELDERASQLAERPKLVDQMLPELTRTFHHARSEQQLCAAIRIARPFLGHKRVRDALFELRADGREGVAAAALSALAAIDPPDQAADMLGKCLADAPAGVLGPTAMDRLCAGLYDLGTAGLEQMKKGLAGLTVDRRVWLAGYVSTIGGPHRQAWLDMLAADADPRVRAAADAAMHPAATQAPPPPVAKTGSKRLS